MVLNLASLLVFISSRKQKKYLTAYAFFSHTETMASGYLKHHYDKQSSSKRSVQSEITARELQSRPTKNCKLLACHLQPV